MSKIFKRIIGVGALVLLSAGVAGVTAYKVLDKKGTQLSQVDANYFNEVFEHSPNVSLASFDMHTQPVDLTEAAEKSLHAVVHIKSTHHSKTKTVQRAPDVFDFFFGDGRGSQQRVQTPSRVGFGSGVIISTDGYIVTNYHVIEGADQINVRLNDNRDFIGRVIGVDPSTDLALVKIEATDLPTLVIGDSDAIKVGEWVLAVGNPFNLASTVTAGIVSAKARTLGVYSGGIESFIQTDAAINQGNSGGALVNARGELVGINAVLSSPTGAYAGYGFAIPTTIMTKVVADLKQYGTVQRAILGIMGSSPSDPRMMGLSEEASQELKKKLDELGVVDGVIVAEVLENGSASESGIQVDDVIVGVDGKKVTNMAGLQEELAKHRPGDNVKITVVRNKAEKDIQVLLRNEKGTTKVVKKEGMEILGAAFRELPADLKQQLRLRTGVQVTGVESGKINEAGVRKGFIILKANGLPVSKVADVEKVLSDALRTPEQVIFLTGIYPSGRRANYAVNLATE